MKEELAKIEQMEEQLDNDKYNEHDGESFRDMDPEDLHPQHEEESQNQLRGTALEEKIDIDPRVPSSKH